MRDALSLMVFSSRISDTIVKGGQRMRNIRPYKAEDLPEMVEIWNEVVEEGNAFPQEERLDLASGAEFFASQSHCGVVEKDAEILGLYILHPNNVGRCGHICNASYAVSKKFRGLGLGEKLVLDSLKQARKLGFRVMQFNAVLKSNPARKLYEKLDFVPLGVVPDGFRHKDGDYEDICLYYRKLD